MSTILHDLNLGTKKVPEVRAGNTVKISHKIKEGEKERTQIFEGLVIRVSAGQGINKTITVRKVVEGVGVEKVFPLHSPLIEKIQIKKESKVRRAKLYYMAKLSGKAARLKGTFISEGRGAAGMAKEEDIIEAPAEDSEASLVEEVDSTEAKAE